MLHFHEPESSWENWGSSATTTHPLPKPPRRGCVTAVAAACIDGSCASTVCLVGHGQSSLFVRKYLYTPCFCVVARALDTYARAVQISPRPRIKRYILCICGRNVRLFFLIICRRFCRGMHSPSSDPPATAARPSHTRCQMQPSPPLVRSLRAVLDQMIRAHDGAM